MLKGILFDIRRDSYMDGPGIRTTVFFKGCNLRCKWCHNPESQKSEKEILFYKNNCTDCGRCKDLTVNDEKFLCFNEAKEICGKEYTVDEVLKEVLKDKAFYETSGGDAPLEMVERAIRYGCKKIQLVKWAFNQEMIRRAHENGIICNIFWSDDVQETKEYLAMGIDTILTNDYNLISQVIKE